MRIFRIIITFLLITCLTAPVYAETKNKTYHKSNILRNKLKITVDDNTVIPDDANILLYKKPTIIDYINNSRTVISINKKYQSQYPDYTIIGYELDGIPFIYESWDKTLSKILSQAIEKGFNSFEEIYNKPISSGEYILIIILLIYFAFWCYCLLKLETYFNNK